jgi:hypothetical protein
MSPNRRAARVIAVSGFPASDGLPAIGAAPTETLLRTCANPLFRAAGLDVNLDRIVMLGWSASSCRGWVP